MRDERCVHEDVASGSDGSGSGIASYQWAIGTTAGGTDIQGYTSLGISGTTANATGLTLTSGTTYFVSIKALDVAGTLESLPRMLAGVTSLM